MPKIQRNSTGKINRRINGKLVAGETSDPCCCDEPTEPDNCRKFSTELCIFAAATYKVVASGINICSDCVSAFDGFYKTTGTLNRTFYIQGRGPTESWSGVFFTSAASPDSGVTITRYSNNTCTDDPEEVDRFQIQMQLAEDEGGDWHAIIFLGSGGFFGTIDLIYSTPQYFANYGFGFPPTYAETVTNAFCTEPTTLTNLQEAGDCGDDFIGGYGGTLVVTPCPPCETECGGCDATVTMVVLEGCTDFSGTYIFIGSGPAGPYGNFFGTSGSNDPPAGCIWQWQRIISFNPRHIQKIYAWFDSVDWHAVLTNETDTVPETVHLIASEAGDVTCTSDKLQGTFQMEHHAGLCIGATATITFDDCLGECGDCDPCCDTYTFTFANSGQAVFNNTFALDLNTVTCTAHASCCWIFRSGSGGTDLLITMYCNEGLGWFMQLVYASGGEVRFEAPDSTCPPDDPASWTRTLDDTGGATTMESIITSDCPP